MRVPVLEQLIQEAEDNYPADEYFRNISVVFLFLCNHTESTLDSYSLWDMCVCDPLYSDIARIYSHRYGSPPLVQSIRDGNTVWMCNYDTLSLREVTGNLLNESAKSKPANPRS